MIARRFWNEAIANLRHSSPPRHSFHRIELTCLESLGRKTSVTDHISQIHRQGQAGRSVSLESESEAIHGCNTSSEAMECPSIAQSMNQGKYCLFAATSPRQLARQGTPSSPERWPGVRRQLL